MKVARTYRFIKSNPYRQGAAEALLTQYDIPIWAILGHLKALDWDVTRTAIDYDVGEDAVRELIPYYKHHREAIDARLQANMPQLDDSTDIGE